MAYFAISTGSLVRALNRNGMMMSVFTSSGQTHVLPRMMVEGAGRLIGISSDQQYGLPRLMLRRWLETRGRFWRVWRPSGQHRFVGMWEDRVRSRPEHPGGVRRIRPMWGSWT